MALETKCTLRLNIGTLADVPSRTSMLIMTFSKVENEKIRPPCTKRQDADTSETNEEGFKLLLHTKKMLIL